MYQAGFDFVQMEVQLDENIVNFLLGKLVSPLKPKIYTLQDIKASMATTTLSDLDKNRNHNQILSDVFKIHCPVHSRKCAKVVEQRDNILKDCNNISKMNGSTGLNDSRNVNNTHRKLNFDQQNCELRRAKSFVGKRNTTFKKQNDVLCLPCNTNGSAQAKNITSGVKDKAADHNKVTRQVSVHKSANTLGQQLNGGTSQEFSVHINSDVNITNLQQTLYHKTLNGRLIHNGVTLKPGNGIKKQSDSDISLNNNFRTCLTKDLSIIRECSVSLQNISPNLEKGLNLLEKESSNISQIPSMCPKSNSAITVDSNCSEGVTLKLRFSSRIASRSAANFQGQQALHKAQLNESNTEKKFNLYATRSRSTGNQSSTTATTNSMGDHVGSCEIPLSNKLVKKRSKRTEVSTCRQAGIAGNAIKISTPAKKKGRAASLMSDTPVSAKVSAQKRSLSEDGQAMSRFGRCIKRVNLGSYDVTPDFVLSLRRRVPVRGASSKKQNVCQTGKGDFSQPSKTGNLLYFLRKRKSELKDTGECILITDSDEEKENPDKVMMRQRKSKLKQNEKKQVGTVKYTKSQLKRCLSQTVLKKQQVHIATASLLQSNENELNHGKKRANDSKTHSVKQPQRSVSTLKSCVIQSNAEKSRIIKKQVDACKSQTAKRAVRNSNKKPTKEVSSASCEKLPKTCKGVQVPKGKDCIAPFVPQAEGGIVPTQLFLGVCGSNQTQAPKKNGHDSAGQDCMGNVVTGVKNQGQEKKTRTSKKKTEEDKVPEKVTARKGTLKHLRQRQQRQEFLLAQQQLDDDGDFFADEEHPQLVTGIRNCQISEQFLVSPSASTGGYLFSTPSRLNSTVGGSSSSNSTPFLPTLSSFHTPSGYDATSTSSPFWGDSPGREAAAKSTACNANRRRGGMKNIKKRVGSAAGGVVFTPRTALLAQVAGGDDGRGWLVNTPTTGRGDSIGVNVVGMAVTPGDMEKSITNRIIYNNKLKRLPKRPVATRADDQSMGSPSNSLSQSLGVSGSIGQSPDTSAERRANLKRAPQLLVERCDSPANGSRQGRNDVTEFRLPTALGDLAVDDNDRDESDQEDDDYFGDHEG